MCREQELSIILESPLIDTNTKIVFMIAKQVGWPVDFKHEDDQTKFRMIVPCLTVYEDLELVNEAINEAPIPRLEETSSIMQPIATGSDCLLVSCSDLVPIFTPLSLEFDEAFLEESALSLVKRSV